MKQVLKSMLVIALVVATAAGSTAAFFTSTVVAEDNEISTGTLLVAVDTAQNEVLGDSWGVDAWNVVNDSLDEGIRIGDPFEKWENAAPGEVHPYYIGVRNKGSLPLNFRAAAVGDWVDGPRFNNPDYACGGIGGADDDLISVENIHLFAPTPTTGCLSEVGCRNLRDSLLALPGGWTLAGGLSDSDSGPVSGLFFGNDDASTWATPGDLIELDPFEFVIYRVDLALAGEDTDNCYQGATYQFDLMVDSKQVDGTWAPLP